METDRYRQTHTGRGRQRHGKECRKRHGEMRGMERNPGGDTWIIE